MNRHFDAIVIGTGQAGPSLARRLAGAGMQVAIVERKLFGGTCVNTGCIPTKTMVASARAAYVARRGAEFGVTISGDIGVDMRRVKARKDEVSGASRTGLEKSLKELKNATVFEGHARFESAREVSVGDERLSAERIFINVGGRASVHGMAGIDEVNYLNNSSMMAVDFLPPRLVVVGGGYIGLEFAQMFRRFGSEVTLVEMGPRLAGHEDEDVSQAIQEILEKEGVQVRLNAKCIEFSQRNGMPVVHLDCSKGDRTAEGTHVLIATGRRPNTDDLGLEKAGVSVDARGYITVDDQLRTNIDGIWALGDCNGKGAFSRWDCHGPRTQGLSDT